MVDLLIASRTPRIILDQTRHTSLSLAIVKYVYFTKDTCSPKERKKFVRCCNMVCAKGEKNQKVMLYYKSEFWSKEERKAKRRTLKQNWGVAQMAEGKHWNNKVKFNAC